MAEPAQTSQTEVAQVLDKIKKEIMERKQLRAQNETNKQLVKMNKNLEKLQTAEKQKDVPEFQFKIPSVNDFVNGFARVSPIFTRDYGIWMKDTVDVAVDGNEELMKIGEKVDRLGDLIRQPADDTNTEYLNLISDQLKAANDDSLKRLDNQEGTLVGISSDLNRIGDTLDEVRWNTEGIDKNSSEQLIRLSSIEKKIGKTGGHIVNALVRIFDSNEKWREKEEMRRGEEGKEGKNNPRATSIIPKDDDQKDENSSGIGAAIAAMLGLNALKGFLLKPFKAIGWAVGAFIGMFSKIGEGIVKLLGPFGKVLKFLKVGPLALISSVFEFGKGFINAKEILGKASVTIVDRVRAGITELVGSFGDLFDWVSKIFGFDTDMGKKFRQFTLWISEKPAEWLNSIVNWISNDLFAGITKNTSLTDIPGKLADNLQSELIKLVDWVTGGISSFIDDGIAAASKTLDSIKKGFSENVKKPFFNMINAIVNAMFDIVDKFVSIIPDALGGETARQKMTEARQAMMIGTEEPTNSPVPQSDQQKQQPAAPEVKQDQTTAPVLPNQDAQTLTPIPSGVTSDAENVTDKTSQLKEAYGSIGGGSLGAAKPTQGRAADNIGQIQSVYSQPPASVIAPIQQNVDNSKKVSTTNNFNSTNLEPSNQTDKTRLLWDW